MEPSKDSHIFSHRPVGDRLDLFRFGLYAVCTRYALTVTYLLSSSKYKLLEVGTELVLAYKCNNLPDVKSVYIHFRLSVYSPAMDEHIIEITGCEVSYRSQQTYHIFV